MVAMADKANITTTHRFENMQHRKVLRSVKGDASIPESVWNSCAHARVTARAEIASSPPRHCGRSLSAAPTPSEARFIRNFRTPLQVQRWIDTIPYNPRHTMRSFRGVCETGTAHCLEAAMTAAVIMERLGHPPLVLSLDSADRVGHAVLAYRTKHGRWGAVGQSDYASLKGRRPLYRTIRDLAWSYVDPFVDETGRVKGYALLDLDALPGARDWRWAEGNVWRIERALCQAPHARLRASDARHATLRARYRAWRASRPDERPPAYWYRGGDAFLG